ncbi:putative reverse transcriptase domain-containing protein [Tanacetum coccineum]|uniref:Reverse transcriptase domain-containing protein n=1 Tax=Tanacetum coccineum TaxID=301880 RepID=A0ABQ5I776_9ASTR
MPWTEMKQLMTAEFCLTEEVQRMEHELWNLKVKEYNIVAYTQRFNELALMCPRMVEPERVKVDAYIWGLTDNIKGEVTSSKPANLNEAVRMAHKVMEQKSQARDERILGGKKQNWMSFQSGNSSMSLAWKGWAQGKVILGTDAQEWLSKKKLDSGGEEEEKREIHTTDDNNIVLDKPIHTDDDVKLPSSIGIRFDFQNKDQLNSKCNLSKQLI